MSAPVLSAEKIVGVVGVTFVPAYPENLWRLVEVDQATVKRGERVAIVLRRNPANPHDTNAIEVHVPALGAEGMIGHLARDVASRLAPRLDDGDRFLAELAGLRVHPDHLDRPGIDVSIRRIIDTSKAA